MAQYGYGHQDPRNQQHYDKAGNLLAPDDPRIPGNKETGLNGRPAIPNYLDMRGSDGNLLDKYKLKAGADITNNLDTRALDMLQNETLAGPGNSPWERMMLGKQAVEESINRDKTIRGADSARQSAQSQLATSGGLSRGARERLARSGAKDLLMANQDVNRQGTLDRYGIGVQAEDTRQGNLKFLPGAQLAKETLEQQRQAQNRDYRTGIDKYNTDALAAEVARQDKGRYLNYAEQMKGYAAENTADATRASADSGGK